MDYFKILNLNREPFSNSPDPDFFYQSAQHLGCLQNLEIAIRLRRGLNVVMGNVGTGKTTLCRELLIRFAHSEEDRDSVEPHLVLDPATTTPGEFLTIIANAFGIPESAQNDEFQIKEGIKDYLYQKGVVDKKTVVLLIDEGQKLPDFALEILREFLNYETNECKLLQIVIFAQNEFRESMVSHQNLADRVNQFITMGPLNFRETRQLIGLRITQSSEEGAQARLFTLPGMYAIYKFSGGYPRRIISLCHQSMLALIIQNRRRAGWATVRSCAERVSVESRDSRGRWALIAGSSLVVLLLVVAGGALNWQSIVSRGSAPAGEDVVAEAQKAPVPVVSSPVPPASQPTMPVFSKKKPTILGRIIVEKGETVYGILNHIYGAYDEQQLQVFVRANQHIKNINRVIRGEVIAFPAIPAKNNPLPPGKAWVAMAMKGSLGEAYETLGSYPDAVARDARLFPFWNQKEGMVYAILARSGFSDNGAADAFIRRLPSDMASGARVISHWPEGTEFYAR
jgi:general secretion pathway protein A